MPTPVVRTKAALLEIGDDPGEQFGTHDLVRDTIETILGSPSATSAAHTDTILVQDTSGDTFLATVQQIQSGTLQVAETTAFTLALSHSVGIVPIDSSSNVDITVPPFADVAFADNTVLWFAEQGASTFTFVAGTGVTVTPKPGSTRVSLTGAGAVAFLVNMGSDVWFASGDLAAT